MIATLNGNVQIWPFLYTRTREVDYGFVVLPEPLAQDRAAALALERALEQPALQEGIDVELPQGTTRLYARAEAAALDGVAVKDKVGREIRSLSGFLASAPLAPPEVDKAFSSIAASFNGLRQLLWGERRGSPMLSWPQLTSESPPKLTAPASLRPADTLPPSPAARSAPPSRRIASHRTSLRPWRLMFEVTLCIVAIGLLGTVHQLMQALNAQRAETRRVSAQRAAATPCVPGSPASGAESGLQRASRTGVP